MDLTSLWRHHWLRGGQLAVWALWCHWVTFCVLTGRNERIIINEMTLFYSPFCSFGSFLSSSVKGEQLCNVCVCVLSEWNWCYRLITLAWGRFDGLGKPVGEASPVTQLIVCLFSLFIYCLIVVHVLVSVQVECFWGAADMVTIPEYYAGKNVLISGATGFMGKVQCWF